MKKVFLFMACFILLTNSVFAQQTSNAAMTFRPFMERNLQENPNNIVNWYKGKTFSADLGVSEYEFNFYRGVAEFYNYIFLNGNDNRLFEAKKTFKSVTDLNIINDIHNYRTSAYLFLGSAFLLKTSEQEIAAHIYQYVNGMLDRHNRYYYTSVYWLLHAGYVDEDVYASLYQILSEADDRAFVYDYLKVRPSTKKTMISRLTKPEKYKKKYYTWTSGISIAALIEDNLYRLSYEAIVYNDVVDEAVVVESSTIDEPMINQEPSIVADINQELPVVTPSIQESPVMSAPPVVVEPVVSKELVVEKEAAVVEEPTVVEPAPVVEETAVVEETPVAPEPVVNEPTVLVPEPELPKPEFYNTNRAPVYINIVSESGIGDSMETSIGGEKIVSSSDNVVSKMIMIERGLQPVEIKVGDKIYKYSIFISEKNNVYTIVIGEKNKSNSLYPLNEKTMFLGMQSDDVSRNSDTRGVGVPASDVYTTEWFENNPYSIRLGIDTYKYNYLKGVALYNDYISGENTSRIVLDEAKSCFDYVVLGNSVDMVSASMYLAFINMLQNGSSKVSDNLIARAMMFSSKHDYLYPTMLYWRLRFGYMTDELSTLYKERLERMSWDTPIVDYTTGSTITLSDALNRENQKIGNYLFANQRASATTTTSQPTVVSNISPKVDVKMNLINLGKWTTRVGFAQSVNDQKRDFGGKIYEGVNIIEVVDGDTSFSIAVNASEENNYIFTFFAY